jgi:ribosomal protein S27AE
MAGAKQVGCPNAGPTTCLAGHKEVSNTESIHSSFCCGNSTFSSGSDGDNIVSHFAMNYHNEASRLGVDINELYQALQTDAEVNPPEWNIHGRQVNVYK